jgi:Flp pilus assembly protein TadG
MFRALGDRAGTSSIEFGLLAPMIAGFVALGAQAWSMNAAILDMRSAVDAGARYYMVAGSSDTAAQAIATAAWRHTPSGGVVTVTRSCQCGGAASACSGLCAATGRPAIQLVSIRATAQWSAWISPVSLAQERSVRIR